MSDQDYPLLSPKEVAARLGVSLNTVATLIKKRQLLARKIGGLWRIRPADLAAAKARRVHYDNSTHEWISLNADDE